MSSAAVKPCRQCAEEISFAAKLCRHCGSHQDWRGYLNLSSTVLALLIALITVATSAVTPLLSVLHAPRSEVVASNPVFHGETLSIVATNLGDRAGVIGRARLESDRLGGQADLALTKAEEAFVRPRVRQVLFAIAMRRNVLDSAMLAMGVAPALVAEREQRVGTLTVWAQQSDGRETSAIFPVRRIDLMDLFDAHRLRCERERKPSYENGCASLKDIQRETDARADQVVRKLNSAARR